MVAKEFAKKVIRANKVNKTIKTLIRIVAPIIGQLIIKECTNKALVDTTKPNLIVVSHDASRTGAPILALNICYRLAKEFNIIVLSLRNGNLISQFEEVSKLSLSKVWDSNRNDIKIKRLCKEYNPRFAIVNSAVSASSISLSGNLVLL